MPFERGVCETNVLESTLDWDIWNCVDDAVDVGGASLRPLRFARFGLPFCLEHHQTVTGGTGNTTANHSQASDKSWPYRDKKRRGPFLPGLLLLVIRVCQPHFQQSGWTTTARKQTSGSLPIHVYIQGGRTSSGVMTESIYAYLTTVRTRTRGRTS